MKKKSFIFIIFTIFVACFIVDSFAYKFDFVTVTDVVRNIKKTYNDLKSYQANFQIVSEKDGKKQSKVVF